ncbi:MAG: hypothetical protein A2161_09225 [Candidatus Schekmanbacteria bacterium RBG_13_48_7]|uniref:MAM domain-containing protein n=1 Tax=Candidatus Schekmanbacteria bacterium RBG_13_48_7 TaxID=1817878 RepID=A0A1F7RMY8_9BACT|nr:MAG: hypothetical protein A2161_09225 [Candidatus Schekmanbacteria bacterium RBG_13_48_7]
MPKKLVTIILICVFVICGMHPCVKAENRRHDLRHGKLPRIMTAEERIEKAKMQKLAALYRLLVPPSVRINSPAEFENQEGILIRWDYGWTDFEDMYCDMIDAIQDVAKVYILYGNASQKTYVEGVLTARSVPLTNIEWIRGVTDSIWARDYGPFPIYKEDTTRAITDFLYYPGRPNDDAVPGVLTSLWSWDIYEENLYFEGGNFMSDGYGVCFVTDSVLSANPGLSTQEIKDIYWDYCGCHTTHILKSLFGTIGHIDMHIKLLDVDTVLIGQVAPSDPNYDNMEYAVNYFSKLTASNGNPYEILRVPMLSGFRTYTNSLLVNNLALVPTYTEPEDTAVLGVYTAAGFTAVPIESSAIIPLSGATHCITHEIPPPCSPPAVPSGVTASIAGDNMIEISWTPTGAPGYYIYRSTTDCSTNMNLFATAHSSPYIDSNVSVGITYYYTICSVDSCLSGLSTCVSETATGYCLIKPEFDGVTSVTNVHDTVCSLKLQWSPATNICGTAIVYNIYRSEDPDFIPSRSNLIAACIDDTEYLDWSFLEYKHQYFYIVRAEDNSGSARGNCGCGNEDDNMVMLDGVPTKLGSIGTYFEDFESGINGWQTKPAGLWHLVNNSTCVSPYNGYHSPTHSWYFGQDSACDYDTGSVVYGSLLSPIIPGITSTSKLSFFYYRHVEPPGYWADETTVEVSKDGGRSWQSVWSKSSNNRSPDIWISSGDISLVDFAGKNILLRFTFNSYDEYDNDYPGWLIDDVTVTNAEVSGPCDTGSPIPVFENAIFLFFILGVTFSVFLVIRKET